MKANPFSKTFAIKTGAVLLLGMCLLCAAGRAAAAAPQGRWNTDYRAGLAKARESRQPVLIMFSASWCGPCNLMKQNVFNQQNVQRALYDYVAIYVDVDEQQALMQQYKAQFLPTFVVLKADGSELGRFVGYNAPDEFLRKLTVVRTELPALARQTAENGADPALWARRARTLESLEDPNNLEQVYEYFKKAKALDPQNRTGVAVDVAFFDAARVTSEGPEAADKRFADFISRYPTSPRAEAALFNRLDIALRQGNDAQAKTLLAQYQQKYPRGKFAKEAAQIKQMLAQPRPPKGTQQAPPYREQGQGQPPREDEGPGMPPGRAPEVPER
jgi:thioredoxin-related protein